MNRAAAGARIRAAREERGLSRERVAADAGICMEGLRRIEIGARVRVEHVAAVCGVVGLPFEVLIDGEPVDLDAPERAA